MLASDFVDAGPRGSRVDDRSSVPAYLTDFVGREAEVARLAELVGGRRLVTITAVGGAGKTRLAVETAGRLRQGFAGGRWFVDLASRREGGALALDVLAAMGQAGSGDGLETLRRRLSKKATLLILDNCEHLVPECAELVAAVLPACPGTHILATSRQPLGVEGETIFNLPTMGLPEATVGSPEEALRHDAVRLFAAVAGQVESGFAVDPANVSDVIQICRRLDGLPLAIVLAAARSTALVPAQIRSRLDDRFGLLVGGRRGMAVRHQTLRGALDWSYELLGARAREVFLRLAVFADGATLDAVEHVCGGSGVLEVVEGLVEQSLLTVDRSSDEARFGMLQTIREYALEVAGGSAGVIEAGDRHLAWYADLARRLGAAMNGPGEPAAVEALKREHGNLVAALEWARRGDDHDALRTLAASLWTPWMRSGRWVEARRWLELALDLPGGDAATRTQLLLGRGFYEMRAGAGDTAEKALAEALRLADRSGDVAGRALALLYRAMVRGNRLDSHAARDDFMAALDIAQEAGDTSLLMRCHYNLGVLAQRLGDGAEAAARYHDTMDLAAARGDRGMQLYAIVNLGEVALEAGDAVEAGRVLDQGWPLLEGLEDEFATVVAVALRMRVAVARADLGEALAGARRLLELGGEMSDFDITAQAFDTFAVVAARRLDPTVAARLLGAADALRERGGPRPPNQERELLAQVPELMRALAGDPTLRAARDEGLRMSPTAAAAYVSGLPWEGPPGPALSDLPSGPAPAPATAAMRREGDVWAISFRGRTSHARHSVGFAYLACLLARPGVEQPSLEIAAQVRGVAAGAAPPAAGIPLLDAQAKAEYRRRLDELAEEVADAEADNDPERAARRRAERDMLVQELARAVGLGDRDRLALSDAERARVSVTKAIRAGIARLGQADRDLGAHLDACVTTGARCLYQPDPAAPVVWDVSLGGAGLSDR